MVFFVLKIEQDINNIEWTNCAQTLNVEHLQFSISKDYCTANSQQITA